MLAKEAFDLVEEYLESLVVDLPGLPSLSVSRMRARVPAERHRASLYKTESSQRRVIHSAITD
ncbi:hypothetical protein [Franconibacter daqui]|uniref:hypothetical protein n=1 Tax=Franconibacter daqui TaxID=2047724 RepID=UPI002DB96009|nr:hypothetical protein [Franconibacter daqui]MEB5923635.1 hypothetical protein [Franconibacter daqui]